MSANDQLPKSDSALWLIYYTTEHVENAQYWQSRLADLMVQSQLIEAEKINNKFLKLHPDLALMVDEDGLWLTANGMKMQPAWQDEVPRLKRANPKNELIARACQIKPQLNPAIKIIDATAGLGHDSLLMASLGSEVILLERHPILFALLESAKKQAEGHDYLANIAKRITVIYQDSAHYLTEIAQDQADVIYLDPMFPARDHNQKSEKKQAQVKKQMQLLHLLLPEDGEMDLGDALLEFAKAKVKRVIVKRPKHATFLDGQTPNHQWQGDAIRFDAYFQM